MGRVSNYLRIMGQRHHFEINSEKLKGLTSYIRRLRSPYSDHQITKYNHHCLHLTSLIIYTYLVEFISSTFCAK
ncbi:hypothetical protein KSS87_001590, partial [Heliosperma pusillum]